jgi:putative ATP-dependent endonuclease of the OLD family
MGQVVRIDSVEIENLRAFAAAKVEFNAYTCLVGANGAGKSTILCALNIFFRQTEHTGTNLQRLDREDFFKGDTSKPIKIRVTFGDLSEAALASFKDYARGGKLIVTAEATFNADTGFADVRHYGERLGITDFAPFFKACGDGTPAADVKTIYEGLRAERPDLPKAGGKDANAAALKAYEAERPDECDLIPSDDQFYGVSKGKNRLEEFVQWVYVPAVKDAIAEQVEAKNSALGKLLARTVRARTNFGDKLDALRSTTSEKYRELLEDNQSVLDDISQSLSSRLSEWAHPGASLRLEWQEERDKSVRIEEPWAHVKVAEGPFEGQLARLGHGLQRSYIIALLQELASLDESGEPRLILAIEEPELYQHPPQARHLAGVLKNLSGENAQVMISTHSPYFVSGQVFEDVRVIRRPTKESSSEVKMASFEAVSGRLTEAMGKPFGGENATLARLQQILQPQLSELFFATSVILVEGREDAAYIQTYLELSKKWDAFRKQGCHIIPVDGKSEILRPLVVASLTNIPAFVIFDADGNENNPQRRAMHETDNKALLKALVADPAEPFPEQIVWAANYVLWPTCLSQAVQASVEPETWAKARNAADLDFNQAGSLGKNVMHIAARLQYLWDDGVRPDPLEKLTERLLAFAAADPVAEAA